LIHFYSSTNFQKLFTIFSFFFFQFFRVPKITRRKRKDVAGTTYTCQWYAKLVSVYLSICLFFSIASRKLSDEILRSLGGICLKIYTDRYIVYQKKVVQ